MKITIEIMLRYAVLFMHDKEYVGEIAQIDDRKTAYNADSITFMVDDYVDGPCHLIVSSEHPDCNQLDYLRYDQVELDVLSKCIALTDPYLNNVLNIKTTSEHSILTIYYAKNGYKSWITIDNVEEY